MAPRPVALVREVPDSFEDCLVSGGSRPDIDVAAARRQHRGYQEALAAGGFTVRVLPAAEGHPDSPFIEDTAVVMGDRALITRPGHRTRRGEEVAVAAALKPLLSLSRMGHPATLDGGDVLQVGEIVFVGRSERTNTGGIAALGHLALSLGRFLVEMEVEGALHLKSAVTALDEHTILAAGSLAGSSLFSDLRVVPAPPGDPEAANVVRLPDGRLLVAARHQETAALLQDEGFGVARCDVSEFAKADGGLTCLSLRLREVFRS